MLIERHGILLAGALFLFLAGAGGGLARPSASSAAEPSSPGTPQDDPVEHAADPSRNVFQSDMTLMTGMTPRDPMGGMVMPGWHLMDMGVARLSWDRQGGPSGKAVLESSNWNMVHAQHDLWGGRLSLMMMNSLEPATMTRRGSPQLFQEGETLDRQPLIDVQHPHDFFMNLSATYRRPLGDADAADAGFWVQYAPVGEPALGPPAFMHRASSGENPTAPLGHHGQDSTHITFGVVTAGIGWRWISLEGSAFHGREPDENRWDFETGKLDSASARVKLSLGRAWSAQVSHGSVHDPDLLYPGVIHRTTASIHYGADGDRPAAVSLIWGRDQDGGRGAPSTALGIVALPEGAATRGLFAIRHPNAPRGYTDYWLLEGAYQITARDQLYGRGEYLDRNFQLLFLKQNALPGQPIGTNVVRIKAATLGYLRNFELFEGLNTGVGADITAYRFSQFLNAVYGSSPLSTHVFVRLRWGRPHGAGHVM